ncbi:N-acetylneuraminate synthase [Halanaerocella petrolearia]
MFRNKIEVGNKIIGGEKTFVIAEIGSNHNQDLELAFKLIDIAVESGADAVKFQSIKPDKIYNLDDLKAKDRELLDKIKLQKNWYQKIRDYCQEKNILYFSSPTYLEAVDILINHGVKLMKIASPQTYGYPKLIEKVGVSNLPTIMSTGYCKYKEIERAVDLFKETGNEKLVLLHCISDYPTDPKDVNLNFLTTLRNMFGVIPGFSDHILGYEVTLGAVAKGAKVIEKHLTLNRDMKGPDHYFALEPDEFKKMMVGIRKIEKAKGRCSKSQLKEFEIEFRSEIEMKLVAKQKIDAGEKITNDKLGYLRNKEGKGVSAWQEKEIVGLKTKNKIKENEFITYEKLY